MVKLQWGSLLAPPKPAQPLSGKAACPQEWGIRLFIHNLCHFEKLLSTQTQLQASIRWQGWNTKLLCLVRFLWSLPTVAFAIKSKIFSLGLGVFEKFALFHLFNKTSIAELKVVSCPSLLRTTLFCLLFIITYLNSSNLFISGMQFLGHTYIPLNNNKRYLIRVSNLCDSIRGNTLPNSTHYYK